MYNYFEIELKTNLASFCLTHFVLKIASLHILNLQTLSFPIFLSSPISSFTLPPPFNAFLTPLTGFVVVLTVAIKAMMVKSWWLW